MTRYSQFNFIHILVVIVASAFAIPAWATKEKSPIQSLTRANDRLAKLLKQTAPEGSAADKQNKEQIKGEINAFLDFKALARLALGKHWDARTEKERDEFVGILQTLIERNYIKQLKGNIDYKINYKSEKIAGDEAHVVTTISVEKENRPQELTIEYKMQKSEHGWKVYDVITDDVSLVDNYKSQFNKIIRKDSYQVLVDKMRRKLDDTHSS